ncbi:MAG: hypothetical protein AAF352_08925 [Pseudomonadota bacterium]
MISLIGSLIGLFSALVPKLLEFFQDMQDRKHELAIMDKQLAAQSAGHAQRLEALAVQGANAVNVQVQKSAAISSGVPWVEALKGSVRPVLTYMFFAMWAVVKGAQYFLLVKAGVLPMEAIVGLWTDIDSGIFSTIIAFWFGERLFSKGKRQ